MKGDRMRGVGWGGVQTAGMWGAGDGARGSAVEGWMVDERGRGLGAMPGALPRGAAPRSCPEALTPRCCLAWRSPSRRTLN
eukprot:6784455-Prymnesium_polylepis.1